MDKVIYSRVGGLGIILQGEENEFVKLKIHFI